MRLRIQESGVVSIYREPLKRRWRAFSTFELFWSQSFWSRTTEGWSETTRAKKVPELDPRPRRRRRLGELDWLQRRARQDPADHGRQAHPTGGLIKAMTSKKVRSHALARSSESFIRPQLACGSLRSSTFPTQGSSTTSPPLTLSLALRARSSESFIPPRCALVFFYPLWRSGTYRRTRYSDTSRRSRQR